METLEPPLEIGLKTACASRSFRSDGLLPRPPGAYSKRAVAIGERETHTVQSIWPQKFKETLEGYWDDDPAI